MGGFFVGQSVAASEERLSQARPAAIGCTRGSEGVEAGGEL